MKKLKLQIIFLGLSSLAFAQENATVNQGELSIQPGTEFATYFDFQNQNNGKVSNDGNMHFFGHFTNDGIFTFSKNKNTGYVVFEGNMSEKQEIKGAKPSDFYNVIFNKQAVDANAFHLQGEITTSGEVNLRDGVVLMDKQAGGAFVFLKGSTHINTSNTSHVRGEVVKEGNEAFKYPIGDGGFYRFASISAPAKLAHSYTGEYLYKNSDTEYAHNQKEDNIQTIDNKEYWIIEREGSTNGSIILTLSWDEATTPQDLYGNEAKGLVVLRWDAANRKWVNEGGAVDYAAKTVTTPTTVKGFGVFTLGKLVDDKGGEEGVEDIVISEGVTPNGDGKNDYFYIGGIKNFKNTVRIYNRWGRQVYYTDNYDTNGNVFNGVAEGKGVINAGEKLPTGTYYYVVEYLKNTNGTNQWSKKVGFIHLETE